MKIIETIEGNYEVVDSINRVATLTVPLEKKLDNIFISSWKTGTDKVVEDYECINSNVIEIDAKTNCTSFKDLKHRVARFLLKNGIEANIPKDYIATYNRNKKTYYGD